MHPSDHPQTMVDVHPPGTVFRLEPGIYQAFSVVPHSDNRFVGNGRVVLDGGDSTAYAFRWSEDRIPENVRLEGLIIQRYAPDPQLAPILAGWHAGGPRTSGWQVINCTIRLNRTGGIRTGDQMVIQGNRIILNGQIGITGITKGTLIQDNDISLNNREGDYDILWEAGGAKLVLSENLTVRGNRVTWNTGPGLWTDIESTQIHYVDNTVSENTGVGILHEISGTARIEGNIITGNGEGFHVWGHGAGILIQNSRDVDILRNRVADNARGIVVMHQERGGSDTTRYTTGPVRVEGNDITMTRGFTGFVQDVGDRSLFTTATVSFLDNRYTLGRHSRYFAWNDRLVSTRVWQDAGQDPGPT